MNLAQRMYVSLKDAEDNPDLWAKEWVAAKNIHLLWFLVPICGFLMFIVMVEESYKEMVKKC